MGYKKPLEIKLQLTEKCNFDCSFCFNKQGSALQNSLSKKDAEKTISKIAEEGIEKIRFTGGEPLLHPDALSLFSYAKEKGLHVMLNTNASLITEAKAKEIANNVDNALMSMHSLKQDGKAANAVKQLATEGCFTRAATILTKENIQNLEKFHKLIASLPFSQWVLLRQIPNQANKQPVSGQDMQTAIEKIAAFNKGRKKDERFLIENALPFCCTDPKKASAVALGAIHEDGHSSLFVDANAAIKPSYFFENSLGNALNNSFQDAWESDFMQRMNSLEFIADICHPCPHVLKCMSGSRFSALLAFNSLYALDPLANPSKFLPNLKRN